MGRWQEVAVLGAYCDALDRRLVELGGALEEPILESARRGLEWACVFARSIDPLNRFQGMPTPRGATPDELKAHLRGGVPTDRKVREDRDAQRRFADRLHVIPMTHHVECVAILEPAVKGS